MSKIESVDFFYLRMPEVMDISDNSQDVILARVSAGGDVGWGECDASPLVTIASYVAPMSHLSCHPIGTPVLGQKLDEPADIAAINREVRARSMDVLQHSHTLAGIDSALWDLLGRRRGEPVWSLLGYDQATPKTPYASQLFGDTPAGTLEKGRTRREQGFRAAKFGWGPFGHGSVEVDADHLAAAREGLGEDGILLVDAGTVFVDDYEAAAARLPALQDARATWYEEPFVSAALDEYNRLSAAGGTVKTAGGEGAHNTYMAKHMIDYAGIGFVQIDAGRMGISDAKWVADYAQARGVTFVNHTFNSHLALSASMQPFAGRAGDELCEYPVENKPVAREVTKNRIERAADGSVRAPGAPGLGIDIDPAAFERYLLDVEIRIDGVTLYGTPEIPAG